MSRDPFDNPNPGPMQAAQHAMRPPLPKRFYQSVSVGEYEGGYTVLLDGKTVKTPAKKTLALPVRELAAIVAREWEAQAETINPGLMPMTRLANLAIDRGGSEAAEAMREEVCRYAASDLVLYRASEPEELVAEQETHWGPVLRWARDVLDAPFVLSEGVNFVAQPKKALAAVRAEVQDYAPPFAVTALASLTQIMGSALISLMLGRGVIAPVEAWNAAHVDENWNMQKWGEDAEVAARRALRLSEFEAAAKMLRLVRGS